jgi:WD40 repeat protein
MDGTARLWDLANRRLKGTLVPPGGQVDLSTWVTTVAFTPDGKTLATGARSIAKEAAGDVSLWDVDSQELKHVFMAHAGNVRQLTFSPDGRLLVTAGHDKLIKLWDVTTRKELFAFSGREPMAFSADSKKLAVCRTNATVEIHDVARMRQLRK